MMFKGRVWKVGDDVDTDQIYPGKYLPITDKSEMARHAMEGTEIGEEFLKHVQQGDIIVAGRNFGCGSSREHAPVAIRGAGVSVVIAESFARIFRRNCVNTGLPILILEGTGVLDSGDLLEIDVTNGTIRNRTKNGELHAKTLSKLEIEIMQAGGLLTYLKNLG
jgi:3-isopropylmalate/(R)-2-methylmalate dehydratase small subunit